MPSMSNVKGVTISRTKFKYLDAAVLENIIKDRARNKFPNLGAKCMADLVVTIERNRQA